MSIKNGQGGGGGGGGSERERADLGAFRTCVRFALVWFCPFPLGVWEGLRFVIVALPGLFRYPRPLFFLEVSK